MKHMKAKHSKMVSAAYQIGHKEGTAWAKRTLGRNLNQKNTFEMALKGAEAFDSTDSKLDYAMGFRSAAFDVAMSRT